MRSENLKSQMRNPYLTNFEAAIKQMVSDPRAEEPSQSDLKESFQEESYQHNSTLHKLQDLNVGPSKNSSSFTNQ
jgi:hypothetical protein